ncbi:ferric-dicitrate binding protein FerR (iron transport regulator) [Pedobacter cryoconitis]|uniref:Ferric-dicitrate binding protein FerR (Iron transport regulator) n=1 Tax=Pedobacter cryoconitis TaxID=188932 RepID=A0A7W8ZJ69_9SPHI|nr:FecR domain-containing protein [Pedobacter cryoconitis]MBB5634783.1 ferric-dicitrate binding protein FerR (iron transport regulator) [Pedobacter cryoconitis]
MKSSEKKNLYRRFLEKELNAAELDEFFLLVENGEFDFDYQEVMPVVEESGIVTAPVREEHTIEVVNVPQTKIRPLFRALIRLTVAASLLLISAIGYLAYRRTENLKQQFLFTTVKVPVGSVRIITLKDHSVVTLNSGSVFKYPASFASDNRKVFLIKGKGFFEIAKDKSRPFTVYSSKLSTTALGTSFTVENYKAYQLEKVCLYTGKVQIGSKEKGFSPLKLIPGQQYTQTGDTGTKGVFDGDGEIKPYAEDGSLEFDNTSLTEALARVASYYNITLAFDKADLKGFAISGKFRNEPVKDVIRTLLFTHHLKFKKIPEGYVIMN